MSEPAENAARGVYRRAAMGAWTGIVGNVGLGVAKLVAGVLGRSTALLADGVDSIGDSLSSTLILLGLWQGEKPADEKHPYGHGKAEFIAARMIGVLLMGIGVAMGYRAVSELTVGEHQPGPALWTAWLAGVSILVKAALFAHKLYLGRKYRSDSLVADAWNHLSDTFASVFALAGILAAGLLGPKWWILDPAAAVLICIMIFTIGMRAFLRSGSALLDEAADPETLDDIRAVAEAVDGVKATEKLLTRRSGIETHADLHVEVDPHLSVGEAHEIATRVTETIKRDVPSVTHVVVHIEPYYPGDH